MISKIAATLILVTGFALGQEQQPLFSWLPKQTLMPAFTANSTAHRISLTRVMKNNQYVGGMGGLFPVVSMNLGRHETQFNIGSTVYTQIIRSRTHLEVVNIDFYVDAVADVDLHEGRVLRFGIGHTSQHFVDDALEILGYQHSINYVRDYLEAFLSQKVDLIRGYLYGGFLYHYRFRIPQAGTYHWLFEIGGEGLDYPIVPNLYAYVAFDIKFREESNYATTQNYQVGIRLNGENSRTIRLAYAYRTGLDERGQFYLQRIHWNTIGLFFEF